MEQLNDSMTMGKETDLIKDLETLAVKLPCGTVQRGTTNIGTDGIVGYMPYGMETISRAIGELKEYYSLKEKMNNGEFSSLPIVAYSPKEYGYRVFWQSKGHYLYSTSYRDKKEANRKAQKIKERK